MSEARLIDPAMPENRMLKFTAFSYGTVAYLTFLVTFLYAIGFVWGLSCPRRSIPACQRGRVSRLRSISS